MKEELKDYLKNHAYHEMWYGTSTESWMDLIDKFFDQYQPERSKREDYYPKDHIWCGCPKCGECKCNRCGALNTAEMS